MGIKLIFVNPCMKFILFNKDYLLLPLLKLLLGCCCFFFCLIFCFLPLTPFSFDFLLLIFIVVFLLKLIFVVVVIILHVFQLQHKTRNPLIIFMTLYKFPLKTRFLTHMAAVTFSHIPTGNLQEHSHMSR